MFCSNCGTELEEGTMFCSNCGAEVTPGGTGLDDDDKTVETVQKKFCPNCGTENGSNDLYCQECGMFFGNAEEETAGGNTAAKAGKAGKVWKFALVIAVLAVVAGLGIVFAPRLMAGLKTSDWEPDFVLYVKDNELTMAKKGKYEPIVVGDRMYNDPDDIFYVNQYGFNMISYSPDHKYIYYPQKLDRTETDTGVYGYIYDLYRKKLGSKKAEEVMIDSQIVDYKVLDNDQLVYIKGDGDRKLYLYQKGESEKIASNAVGLRVSSDGKYILWMTDNKLYVQDANLKSDKVKLDSNVSNIYGVSEDFSTIVYQKNEDLYVMKGMNESEKIASDVYSVYVYDIDHSLKIYCLQKGGEENLSYYDLIEDDLLAQDQQIEEPRIEDYQRVTYKDSFWGVQEKVEVDESYYEEVDKYQQKQTRDSLRAELESNTVNILKLDVYYYDDAIGDAKKVLTILERSNRSNHSQIGTDTALMYVFNIDWEKGAGPNLSELEDAGYNEMQQEIMQQLEKSGQLLYIENGEIHEIEEYEAGESDNAGFILISADEDKQILYLRDYDNNVERLYSYDYGRKDASLELITDELGNMISGKTDEVCYINKDGEMYYGDTMIAEECYGIGYAYENGAILYMTDMNKTRSEGTLHLYQGGKSVEIADDVPVGFGMKTYGMFDSDKISFLTDYNFKKNRGDLNVYDGETVKMIDSDVAWIIY